MVTASSAPPATSPERAGRSPAGRFASRFNESDTVLWAIERDPTLRTTIVAIALLDRAPDWRRLRERLLEASIAVPRLRQRVVAAPLRMGPPRWELDDRFDLDYHLRRVAAPPPGDLATVLELAGPIVMAAFDKDRPLWEFTLVEGLTGGRAALIEKVHHSFTDGVGGIALARTMVDTTRNPRRHHRAGKPPEARHATALDDLVELAAGNARSATKTSLRAASALPRVAASAAADPVHFAESAVRGARSLGKLLTPVSSPLSPVMRRRGLSRRLQAFDVPLHGALAAAHSVDGTLNDFFLAAVTGGMRRYHERHGVAVDALRVTMPVNLRREDDPVGNNRFTPARFVVPVTGAPVGERMRQLGDLARSWRREPALPLSEAIAGVLNRLPVAATTALFGSMLKGIDFVATNVPGIDERVFIAGAEVLRHYAFPPPSGAACGIALLSHGGQCCIGITIDTDAVPDGDVLTECLRAGFAEALEAGQE